MGDWESVAIPNGCHGHDCPPKSVRSSMNVGFGARFELKDGNAGADKYEQRDQAGRQQRSFGSSVHHEGSDQFCRTDTSENAEDTKDTSGAAPPKNTHGWHARQQINPAPRGKIVHSALCPYEVDKEVEQE